MERIKDAQKVIADIHNGYSTAKHQYMMAINDIEKAIAEEGYELCKVQHLKDMLEDAAYTDDRGMKVLSVAYVARLLDQACE